MSSTLAAGTGPAKGQPNATLIVTVIGILSMRARATRASAVFETFFGRGVLVAFAELVRGRQCVVDLVDPRRDGPLVASLVEDEARVRGARIAVQRYHDLLCARHLRDELGIDEARRLHASHAGGRKPVAELCS